jgi:hypothetical protein
VIFHNSFGPAFGHSWSRPVSREIPLRSGPRHCGQSLAMAESAVDNQNAPAARIPNENFMRGLSFPSPASRQNYSGDFRQG